MGDWLLCGQVDAKGTDSLISELRRESELRNRPLWRGVPRALPSAISALDSRSTGARQSTELFVIVHKVTIKRLPKLQKSSENPHEFPKSGLMHQFCSSFDDNSGILLPILRVGNLPAVVATICRGDHRKLDWPALILGKPLWQ